MGRDTLYELTRRTVPIIKNEPSYLSWCNSIITVQTSKRLNFLEYSYNLECLDKDIDLIEASIASPKSSPATELCDSPFLKLEMRNVDYAEMLVNPSFWPHNSGLTEEMTLLSMCKWSPPNFIKSESVLAVLNNIGGVEFFGQKQLRWKSMQILSPYIKKALKYNAAPKTFEQLKESVFKVETSAVCWAQELNQDNSCYFVTAQKNGTILFWQIYNDICTIILRGNILTEMVEMANMIWIPKSDDKFWLICGDALGRLNAFDFVIENETVTLLQGVSLWQHKDRMMAHGLNYVILNKYIVFVCSKHRHLLIQVLDENGLILSQYLKNVNDYRITDIVHTTDGIYLSTVNVKIYKVNISYENGSLDVDLIPLDIKDQYANYDLHSFKFSPNHVMCAMAMVDRRVLCRKELHKMQVIFLSTDFNLESVLPTLINNPTKLLTYHWDCVELLRFQITKLKITPKLDYNELFTEAYQDVYKLKIYLILIIFFSSLKKLLRISSNIYLPETSIEKVKEKILLSHAQSVLNNLCNKCQMEGKLSDFDMESLYGSKNYLEYYSKKYKTEVEFDKNVLSALKNNCVYVCQCCDANIDGFSCSNGHLNMFCMESFTPITNDNYLLCRCCGCMARCDLDIKYPLCVFCDQHLVKFE